MGYHICSLSRLHQIFKTGRLYLRQKIQPHWFKQRENNSKYFHALIRGKRRKLFIYKIYQDSGECFQGNGNIVEVACEHFQQMFIGHDQRINEETLQYIPRMITLDQNQMLQIMPTLEDLKQLVFAMNPNSVAELDRMNRKFFQSYWETIKMDLFTVVQYFFCGNNMP